MRVIRFICCLLSSSPLWTGPALAETFYPLITYKCDTGADIITITNTLLRTEEGKNYSYSDAEGTYSPWDLVDIENSGSNEQNHPYAQNRQILRTQQWKIPDNTGAANFQP